jgi:hypothetical protein
MGGPTLSSPIGEPFQHAQSIHKRSFSTLLQVLAFSLDLHSARHPPADRAARTAWAATSSPFHRVAHALMMWDLNSGLIGLHCNSAESIKDDNRIYSDTYLSLEGKEQRMKLARQQLRSKRFDNIAIWSTQRLENSKPELNQA